MPRTSKTTAAAKPKPVRKKRASTATRYPELAGLSHDELVRRCAAVGLHVEDDATSDELVDLLGDRVALLLSIDREALLDVLRWAHRSARPEATNEELAREIARIEKTNYDSLSRRGLETLARLRDIEVLETDTAGDLIDHLRRQETFWQKFHRRRRRILGSWLSRIIEGESESAETNAEEPAASEKPPIDSHFTDVPGGERPVSPREFKASLRKQIEDLGVVGGIAQRLRGAADDYIKVKLDEIEARIDSKLNEIDERLAEWRDREVANRLHILRITLGFTVLVAILSLGYNLAKQHWTPGADLTGPPGQVAAPENP